MVAPGLSENFTNEEVLEMILQDSDDVGDTDDL
jgi:hypothetical protein